MNIPNFNRHNKTLGVMTFSYSEPLACTVATFSRNITFQITENWLEILQENYIKPMDITHLYIYGKNDEIVKLLKKTLFNVVILVFHPPKRYRIKCSDCYSYGCSISKAQLWYKKFFRQDVKISHWS